MSSTFHPLCLSISSVFKGYTWCPLDSLLGTHLIHYPLKKLKATFLSGDEWIPFKAWSEACSDPTCWFVLLITIISKYVCADVNILSTKKDAGLTY